MLAEAAESLLSVAKIHLVVGVRKMKWIFHIYIYINERLERSESLFFLEDITNSITA
jgi:hypothetical protein